MVKQCYLLLTLLVIVHSLNYGTVLIQNEGGGQIQSKEILFSQPFQQIPQVAIALLNGQGDIFAEIHEVNKEGIVQSKKLFIFLIYQFQFCIVKISKSQFLIIQSYKQFNKFITQLINIQNIRQV